MKFLYYVKTTLKGLISTIIPTIAYFILFPLILSGVFFMMENVSHNSDLKLKEVTVQVVDLDKSEMSKTLIDFLKGENFKEFVEIKEEIEPSNKKSIEGIKGENKLVIHKGYEEDILSSKKTENLKLEVTDLKNEHSLEAIKNILDMYHQNIYMEVSGGNRDEINRINSISVVNENILEEVEVEKDIFSKNIAGLIGFIISMLMYNSILGSTMGPSVAIGRRICALPLKKSTQYMYEYLGMIVYSFIIIGAYVFFFRLIGLAFKGNIFTLIGLVFIGSIFVSSVISLIGSFKKGIAKIAGNVLFLLFIAGSESLGAMGGKIGIVSPTVSFENAFVQFNNVQNITGNEKALIITLILGLALASIGFLRTILKKECI